MSKPQWVSRNGDTRCPKIGLLGDRCIQERFHGGNHTFPPNPHKTPGIKPVV